jgi:hypothetical protein
MRYRRDGTGLLLSLAWLLLLVPGCSPKQPVPAAAAVTKAPAALADRAAPKDFPLTCEGCKERFCRNYLGSGVDVLGGCLEKPNEQHGAKPDPSFVRDCTAVVKCAVEHKCAFDPNRGPVHCYCGSRFVDECKELGPAEDAPCVAEWKAATRGQTNMDVLLRFDQTAYPAGWAFHLLECMRDQCGEKGNYGRCLP